jgi:hypothetical protein
MYSHSKEWHWRYQSPVDPPPLKPPPSELLDQLSDDHDDQLSDEFELDE